MSLQPSPLERRTELQRRTEIVRRTPLRRTRSGRARPDEPLATWCEAAIDRVCTGRAVDRHHIIRRGPGSSDEAWNTLDICRPCHRHIHANPAWARSVGFLRRRPAA